MQLEQQMNVGAYDPEAVEPSPFLPRDRGEVAGEERRATRFDGRLAVARGPDDMDVEAVAHERNFEGTGECGVTKFARARPIHLAAESHSFRAHVSHAVSL
jgi:hypothetical protein